MPHNPNPNTQETLRHRHAIHQPATLGERAADLVAHGMGSWRFVIIQTTILALWITANLTALIKPWDVFPFILLNLGLSAQAAYAAPVLQMASNRQAAKDRMRDDHEAEEVTTTLAHLEHLIKLQNAQMGPMSLQTEQCQMLTSLIDICSRHPQPGSPVPHA